MLKLTFGTFNNIERDSYEPKLLHVYFAENYLLFCLILLGKY